MELRRTDIKQQNKNVNRHFVSTNTRMKQEVKRMFLNGVTAEELIR